MYEVLSRRFRRAQESGQHEDGTDHPWRLPDLLVVDGGKGQLGVALAAARDAGIDVRPGSGLPIIALAKERDAGTPDLRPLASDEHDAGAPELVSPPAPESGGDAARDTGNAPAQEAGGKPERAEGQPSAKKPSGGSQPDRVFLPQAKDAIPIRNNSAEMFVLQRLRDEAHRFAVTFHRSQRKKRTLHSALSLVSGVGPTRQRDLLRHFGSLRKIREASLEDLLAVPGLTRKVAAAVHEYFAARPETESASSWEPWESSQTLPRSGSGGQSPPPPTRSAPSAPASETEDADEDAVESAFSDPEVEP